MLRKLTGLQQLFIVTLIIIICTILFFFISYGLITSLIMSSILLAFLYITKSVCLVHRTSKNIIRIASLTTVTAIVASFSVWQDFVRHYLSEILYSKFGIKNTYIDDKVFPYAILVTLIIVVFIVNYFSRDESGMGIHPDSIKDDIADRDYKDKLNSVCEALRDELRNINIKTNWSNQFFVPLDAEVEIKNENKRHKMITDLLRAIKKSDDRLFLVLGEPGSGKSVALRKLCIDLLSEVGTTQKIPIYINLKEWNTRSAWNENNKPTLDDLKEFVVSYLRNIDIGTSQFFNEYFDKLYDSGRLYFVLDSFDEIPSVLNEKESSELINHLSELFFKFLKGARSNTSQGILASRQFRKPTKLFQVNTTLEIVPLAEKKIIELLEKRINKPQYVVKEIFKNRHDLIIVLKNPFLTSLFVDYQEKHDSLPENQFVMYYSYIINILQKCSHKLEEYDLNDEEVIEYAKNISLEMFSENSLEISIDTLVRKHRDKKYLQVSQILRFAKIGRSSNDNLFSFSHRRFSEFFYVLNLNRNDNILNLEAIPNDSQARDALVLFCQITDEKTAIKIAEYCWNVINENKNIKDRKTLHTLRFLYDAYIGRKDCINNFQIELFNLIRDQVRTDNTMIMVKAALEFVGLLSDEQVDIIIIEALNIGNYWTNETAIKSCRHLGNISKTLENNLIDYVSGIRLSDLIQSKLRDLYFSLSLSDAFVNVKKRIFLRFVDIIPTFIVLYIPVSFLLLTVLSGLGFDVKYIVQFELTMYIAAGLSTLLFIYYFNAYTLLALYSKARYESFKYFIIVVGGNALIVTGFFLITYYFPKIFPNFTNFILKIFSSLSTVGHIIGVVFLILFLLGLLRRVYEIISDLYNYCKVNVTPSMSRPSIFKIYSSINFDFFKNLLLLKIESTVDVVSGDWPDEKFLLMTTDSYKIRLAKLDEKWLGYDN